MTNNEMIANEARRLHKLGCAVHWCMPREKRPVGSKWTTGPRREWTELASMYEPGMNLGVRTGQASKIGDGYLTCFDLDVKDAACRKEAVAKLKEVLGDNFDKCPEVRSGSGNGSRHLYALTPSPFKMVTLAKHEGWELCAYSEGRQMVLPPSIHPSGKPYVWRRPLTGVDGLPMIAVPTAPEGGAPGPKREKKTTRAADTSDFTFEVDETLDVRWLPDLTDKTRKLIMKGLSDGEIIKNRSDKLLPAARGLLSAGLDKNGILTVLTDRTTYLGKCAFDHAKTDSRQIAARWLWKYSVRKIITENDPVAIFKGVQVEIPEKLDETGAATQAEEIGDERHWTQDLQKTKEGKIKDTLQNTYLILKNSFGHPLFRFNEFSKNDEVWRRTPWGGKIGSEFQERDVQKIRLWASQQYDYEPSDAHVWSALVNIADENSYHPIKEYMEGLPAHDGVPRVDFFLERYLMGAAPLAYMRAVSRKTIVAMIARVFQPGIKFDTMLVLEGAQGLMKSTAISALAGKAWFSDVNLNLKNKDSIADMAGKWVLEQGEMQVMNKHDVAELKQFLSRDTDRMRPSYGRKSQDYPRQSVFIGTTNDDIYLKDTSGSRRFLPIRVTGNCDVEAIKRDRDQIFAEALAMYRAGETVWIADTETSHLVKDQQAERESSDELISVIEAWLDRESKNFDFNPNEIRMTQLYEIGGPFNASTNFSGVKLDELGQKRISSCLKILGFARKIVRKGDKTVRLWQRYPENEAKLPVQVTENHE